MKPLPRRHHKKPTRERFPLGGMYRVIASLVSIAEAQGVHFMYNTPVKRIEVDGNHATGVVLQDGSFLSADVIVANADLPYVYSHLLPAKAEANHLEDLKYTCSSIMFYWGVDQVYPQLGTHNVFLAGDHRASFDRIFRDHLLPDEPSFYVHAPARTDPSAAPLGQDTLMVLVPVGHMDAGTSQDWSALQSQARSAVLHRLAGAGIVDLEKHVKFEVSYTPCDWLSNYNLAKGGRLWSQSQLPAGGLPAAAQPAPPLWQPLLCRKQHAPWHRLAHGAALGSPDDGTDSEGGRRTVPCVELEANGSCLM
jgi:phytoene desaturase